MTKPDPAADLSACVQALQDIIAKPGEAVTIAEKALAGVVMARMGVAAAAPGRVTVRIPSQIDNVDLAWAKWVLHCNPKAAGGYKFEGPFLKLGQPAPLPAGAVVMLVTKSGLKRQQAHAIAQIVQNGGELSGWSGPAVHRFNLGRSGGPDGALFREQPGAAAPHGTRAAGATTATAVDGSARSACVG